MARLQAKNTRRQSPQGSARCRVGEDITVLTPRRPGRAAFPHPVLHGRVSLMAVWILRITPSVTRLSRKARRAWKAPLRAWLLPAQLSVVVSWTGLRSSKSSPVFPANGSRPVAPPFPQSGPGGSSSPRVVGTMKALRLPARVIPVAYWFRFRAPRDPSSVRARRMALPDRWRTVPGLGTCLADCPKCRLALTWA